MAKLGDIFVLYFSNVIFLRCLHLLNLSVRVKSGSAGSLQHRNSNALLSVTSPSCRPPTKYCIVDDFLNGPFQVDSPHVFFQPVYTFHEICSSKLSQIVESSILHWPLQLVNFEPALHVFESCQSFSISRKRAAVIHPWCPALPGCSR